MNAANERSITDQRAGEGSRSNPNRYFHVMTQGWYLFTREGIKGPFLDKDKASQFLTMHISSMRGDKPAEDVDPSTSWRL